LKNKDKFLFFGIDNLIMNKLSKRDEMKEENKIKIYNWFKRYQYVIYFWIFLILFVCKMGGWI